MEPIQPSIKAKVRKDYRAVKPYEKERYFTCLKMLEILPPTEPGNKRVYYNITEVLPRSVRSDIIKPNNIHD